MCDGMNVCTFTHTNDVHIYYSIRPEAVFVAVLLTVRKNTEQPSPPDCAEFD